MLWSAVSLTRVAFLLISLHIYVEHSEFTQNTHLDLQKSLDLNTELNNNSHVHTTAYYVENVHCIKCKP